MSGAPFREAARRFQKIEGAVNRGARRAEAESSAKFTDFARLMVPVESGALSRSITPHDDGTVTIEGTGEHGPAEYHDIVETGRESGPLRQAPQPYLRPAASLLATQVPLIARREVAKAVAAEVARMQGGK